MPPASRLWVPKTTPLGVARTFKTLAVVTTRSPIRNLVELEDEEEDNEELEDCDEELEEDKLEEFDDELLGCEEFEELLETLFIITSPSQVWPLS